MNSKNIILISISTLFIVFVSTICFTNIWDKVSIVGSWHGKTLSQNGSAIGSDWSNVKFIFNVNGKYSYTNASEYTENGKYEVKDHMLVTIPENDQTGNVRSVEIIKLKLNSLVLRMNDNGNEIILQLERV